MERRELIIDFFFILIINSQIYFMSSKCSSVFLNKNAVGTALKYILKLFIRLRFDCTNVILTLYINEA